MAGGVLQEHRRHQPDVPDHRQGPPGRLVRRLHRRRRPRSLLEHGEGLVPSPTGTARRSSPNRPGTSSPPSPSRSEAATSPRTTSGTWSPATTSGPRSVAAEVGPDAVRSGSATGTTISSSTTPRPKGSRPAAAEPTRPLSATRPTAGSTGSAPWARRRKTTTRTLDPNDGPGLVAALKDDNMFWRLQAQRLLIGRGKKDVVPALIELVKDKSVDAIGLNPAAIHAPLERCMGWGVQNGSDEAAVKAVFAALEHPSAGVRRNAVQVFPLDKKSPAEQAGPVRSVRSLDAPSMPIRWALSVAARVQTRPGLERLPRPGRRASESSGAAAALLIALVRGGMVEGDRWLLDAATITAALPTPDRSSRTSPRAKFNQCRPCPTSLAGHRSVGGRALRPGGDREDLRRRPRRHERCRPRCGRRHRRRPGQGMA